MKLKVETASFDSFVSALDALSKTRLPISGIDAWRLAKTKRSVLLANESWWETHERIAVDHGGTPSGKTITGRPIHNIPADRFDDYKVECRRVLDTEFDVELESPLKFTEEQIGVLAKRLTPSDLEKLVGIIIDEQLQD